MGERSKGLPAGSGVCAGWTHEHVTDEQRRQRTIWGYIMVLSSRYNTADIQNPAENTEMTETWPVCLNYLPIDLLWEFFDHELLIVHNELQVALKV